MATTTGCESISLTELGERPIPTVPEGPNNDSSVTEAEAKVPYLKLIASGFSFFVAGVNDGSLGSLLPYVLETYHVSTGLVIIVYVLPPMEPKRTIPRSTQSLMALLVMLQLLLAGLWLP